MKRILPSFALFLIGFAACAGGSASRPPRPWDDVRGIDSGSDVAREGCIPDCADRTCGPDGCGGSCGNCAEGLSCAEAEGRCVPDCRDPFEPDDTWDQARPLQPDAPEVHSLCPVNDQDFYAVTLDRRMGLRVSLETEPDRSVLVSIFVGVGTLVEEDGTDEAGRASVVVEDLPAGIYRVLVRPEEPTEFIASYRIALATECAPDCGTRSCGDDGCGGTCGTCPPDHACNPQGLCVSTCVDALEPDGSPQQAIPIVPGDGLNRSLCPPADEDWYRVEVPPGSLFRVRFEVPEGFAVDAYLLSKDFFEVDSAALSGQGQVFLEPPVPDTYYLLISADDSEVQVPLYKIVADFLCAPTCDGRECGDNGCGGSCGDCDSHSTCDAQGRCVSTCVDAFEPDDVPDEAHDLEPGVPRTHSICPAEDVDFFRFEVPEAPHGWAVRVETSGPDGDTEIWVLNASLNEVESDDDGGGGAFSRVETTELPAGIYFVEVRSKDAAAQIPTYSILWSLACVPDCEDRQCGDDGCGGSCGGCDPYSICDVQGHCVSTCVDAFEPDDLPGQAHPLFPKVPRTHSVCPGEDVDWFLIQLFKPTNVTVSVEGSGALDIELLDVQQTELDSSATDFSGPAVVSGLGLSAGTYFVRVSSSDGLQVPVYQIVLSLQ